MAVHGFSRILITNGSLSVLLVTAKFKTDLALLAVINTMFGCAFGLYYKLVDAAFITSDLLRTSLAMLAVQLEHGLAAVLLQFVFAGQLQQLSQEAV